MNTLNRNSKQADGDQFIAGKIVLYHLPAAKNQERQLWAAAKAAMTRTIFRPRGEACFK